MTMRLFFSFILFAIVTVGLAKADELPEYEGVYIRTTDGALHELPKSAGRYNVAFGKLDGGGFGAFIGNYPSRKPAYLLDVWKQAGTLPVFEGSAIKSFVINSREKKPKNLNLIVFSQDFFGAQMKALAMEGSTKNYLASHNLEHAKKEYFAIDSNYGYGFSNARVKNIDAFNTEFFLDNVRWDGNTVPNFQKSKQIPTMSFSVTMSDGYSYYFLTRSQVETVLVIDGQTQIYFDDDFTTYLSNNVPQLSNSVQEDTTNLFVVTGEQGAPLRSGGSTEAQLIMTLPKGSVVKFVEWYNSYRVVTFSEGDTKILGYIWHTLIAPK